MIETGAVHTPPARKGRHSIDAKGGPRFPQHIQEQKQKIRPIGQRLAAHDSTGE
jgi:hypothetical protein